MDRISLTVDPRNIIGKKVKQLRKAGNIPGHIYGYNTEPINVSVNSDQLHITFKHSGETGLIDLKLEEKTYPVLIKDIQTHAVSGDYLNVDFHKVNLKEKVTVSVPVVPIGEPEAETNKIGLLVQPILELEIEALPTDLIENIEVPVEHLKELDEAIYVKDITVPSTVTILAEPDTMLFKIDVAEMPEVVEEEPVTEEATETEGEAGEETTGEETTQEGADSESDQKDE